MKKIKNISIITLLVFLLSYQTHLLLISLLSTLFGIFTTAAEDETTEKQVIKELKK